MGPFTYSLKIGEKYVREGGTDAFPAYEVHATTDWNYADLVDVKARQFTCVQEGRAMPKDGQPFTPDNAPIEITARARKIPNWQSDHLGLVGLDYKTCPPSLHRAVVETINTRSA